jgi:hypothetical protein
MRLNATAHLLLLCAGLSGCSRHAAAPTVVGGPPPVPELVATQPLARATGVLYDTEIWAQFSRPLDGRSINATTVFLKLDTTRQPVVVSYDGVTRRILVRPTVTLALQRTYTVEISTAVHGADGTPIAPDVFFQFKTNSLRRIQYDYPTPGELEGPLAALGWGRTQGPVDNIFYDVYVSTDSLEVQRRSATPLMHAVFTRFVPAQTWPMGSTVYWAVTTENATTHERLDGAMQSFQVLDADTPLDSMWVGERDHGSNDLRTRGFQYCNQPNVGCGPSYNCSIHWHLSSLPANVRFGPATILLTATDAYANTVPQARPTAWMAQNDWVSCSVFAPGPPFSENSGLLADGAEAGSLGAEFTSSRLGAFFETQYRGRTLLYGTLIRSSQDIVFHSTLGSDPSKWPRALIRFYRLPAAPAP